MDRGELRALYVIGENPVQSEADQHRATRLLERLECLVVQDLFLTGTAEIADVVLPAAAAAFESEGTVTSSERRVQRMRRTKPPAGESRDDLDDHFRAGTPTGTRLGPARSPSACGMSCARCRPCTRA